MPTPNQIKFRKAMNRIHKENAKKEKFYSYIEDKYISSYYEKTGGSGVGKRKIQLLNIYKYTFITLAVLFCLIIFLAAPFSKFVAIPFTLMICSVILVPFGLVHPSLAFLDGKSRWTVIWVYVLLFIVSFVVGSFLLLR